MLIVIVVFLYLWWNRIHAGRVEHLKHMLDGWVVAEVIRTIRDRCLSHNDGRWMMDDGRCLMDDDWR